MSGSGVREVRLDGAGWAGGPVRAVLGPDDVSLTYDAARREVVRHAGGRAEVVGDDPFAVLETELVVARAAGRRERWFGYLGYAARGDLPALVAAGERGRVPDAVWLRPSRVERLAAQAATSEAAATPSAPEEVDDGPPAWYREAFARVQERLHAGDTYETNLTHRVARPGPAGVAGALAVHERLRALNPAPHGALLRHEVPGLDGASVHLVCASPEGFARVTPDGARREDGADGRVLETRPIKGTTPRSADPAADAEAARRLAADPRYRAENLMVADLLRHDVGSVSEAGTVTVPRLMEVEPHPTVHQLVTTVRGRLRTDVTTVGALRALFPPGSMTGAPKRSTMEVVAEVETTPRGPYAGALGWVDADGRADLAVVIRSLWTAGDGHWTLGTGGGVTVHSDLASEWAETGWKSAPLLAALAAAPPARG